jgi:hypothetical protein
MRPSDAGATNLVDRMPPVCEDVALGPVTNGIWMKSSSRSTESPTISGERSTRTVSSSIFSSSQDGPICCHPVLPQAVACHGAPPTRDHHRQTAQLRGGETDCAARRCSSTTSVFEQPGRELSSTDARAGETNAPVQIRSARPAFCRGARHYRFALPPPKPSILRS